MVVMLLSIYYHHTIIVRHTLYEARNAELSLRLLATEYYGRDQRIYDPLTPDGLAEGVGEEMATLSGAEGEFFLSSWDAVRRAPRSFTYKKGKLAVIYHYDEQKGCCWNLYYQFREATQFDWTNHEESESPAAE